MKLAITALGGSSYIALGKLNLEKEYLILAHNLHSQRPVYITSAVNQSR